MVRQLNYDLRRQGIKDTEECFCGSKCESEYIFFFECDLLRKKGTLYLNM